MPQVVESKQLLSLTISLHCFAVGTIVASRTYVAEYWDNIMAIKRQKPSVPREDYPFGYWAMGMQKRGRLRESHFEQLGMTIEQAENFT